MPSFKLNTALLMSALCGSYVSAINVEHWTTITVSGDVCGTSTDVNYLVGGVPAAHDPAASAGGAPASRPASGPNDNLGLLNSRPGISFIPAASSAAAASDAAGLPASRTSTPSFVRSTTTVPGADDTSSAAGLPASRTSGVSNTTVSATDVSSGASVSSPVDTSSTDSSATDSSATDVTSSATDVVDTTSTDAVATTSSTTTGFLPTGTGQVAGSDFALEVLAYHNYVRDIHGAPALAWDQTLADYAQSYADYLASDVTCPFAHSGGSYGENLAIGYNSVLSSMEAWYNEVADYDFVAAEFVQAASHFTQMVWKDTTSVGCGFAQCSPDSTSPYASGYYLVCEYNPRGNFIGEFAANVETAKASTTAYGGPGATPAP